METLWRLGMGGSWRDVGVGMVTFYQMLINEASADEKDKQKNPAPKCGLSILLHTRERDGRAEVFAVLISGQGKEEEKKDEEEEAKRIFWVERTHGHAIFHPDGCSKAC